jgi:hypothetical protein
VKTALLDANVLIALLWPVHEHHEAALAWFEASGRRRWATCPLTQLAFARVVSNPAFSPDALTPAQAVALLARNVRHPRHVFWPDDLPLQVGVNQALERLQGHRQLVDAYLVALAVEHGGVLTTFDSGLDAGTVPERRAGVELIGKQ